MSNLLEIPQERHKVVEAILKAKTLYQCVFVKQEASASEIGKQFKKVSIFCHPDKNDHPKAAEAFKRVGEAKRILTDDTSRRRYDQTGSTSDRPSAEEYFRAPGYGGGGRHGPTPEDIFEAFFGTQSAYSRRAGRGGNPFFDTGGAYFDPRSFGGGPRFQQQRHANGRQFQQQASTAGAFAPFMGLILLFLIVIGLNWVSRAAGPQNDSFTLWKTEDNTVPHYTSDGLGYWLPPGFYSSAKTLTEKHRKSMDTDVYNAWFRFREHECAQDLSQSRRNFAQPPRPKSCTMFDELKALKNRREW